MILRPNGSPREPVRVMIAEDERASREALAQLVEECEGLELVGVHAEGRSLLQAMPLERPELLLLDIEMPGMDGLQVVEGLPREHRPQVVFITAHSEHAVMAFDVGAVDYIAKPYDDQRVHRAIQRALGRMERSPDETRGNGLPGGRGPWVRRLLVQRSGRSAFFLPVTAIRYLEAEQNYVRIHHGDGRDLVRSSLSDMEARLDPAMFRRVHRSYVVNLREVAGIEPRGVSDYQVVLNGGETVPVGRAYRDHVLTDA